jgi:hypothetical protein
MFKCAMAMGLALLAGGSIASAAIVYEPVTYQHRGANGSLYYYGGRHPDVVADARCREWCLRYSDPSYQTGFIAHGVQPPAVYSDCAPYMNLSAYGYTAADAHNEALANQPRYFRKADLLPAGHVDADGDLIVPADAQPVPSLRRVAPPTTQPTPHAIIIIPKSPKAQPLPAGETKVAAAR